MIDKNCYLEEISKDASHDPEPRKLLGIGRNWVFIHKENNEAFIFLLDNKHIGNDISVLLPGSHDPQTVILSSPNSEYNLAIPAFDELLSAKKIFVTKILSDKEESIRKTMRYFGPIIKAEMSKTEPEKPSDFYLEQNLDNFIIELIERGEFGFLDCYIHDFNESNFQDITTKRFGG